MRTLTTVIMSGVMAVGLMWTGWAAEMEEPYTIMEMESRSLAEVQPMHRATDLLGRTVMSPNGESLGRVEEIVLTVDRLKVEYLALNTTGADLLEIPLGDLRMTADGLELVYEATAEDLAARASFTRDDWPDALFGARRAGELVGFRVIDPAGERVGTIRDLLIDAENGMVTEATIGVGGIMGLGERFLSTGWSQVRVYPDEKQAEIILTSEEAGEMALERGEYWERLGFVGEATESEMKESQPEPELVPDPLPGTY